MSDLSHNLIDYLEKRGSEPRFTVLTPDASTREYFRIAWNGGTAVACAYTEPIDPASHPYIDTTSLFLEAGLPVARIFDVDPELAIIVQEDFGDEVLRNVMLGADDTRKEAYLEEAMGLIARIQAATGLAFERGALASKLSFDFEKLSWELDYFTEHYFTTLRGRPLSGPRAKALKTELDLVATSLAGRAAVLTHRDFHAANLMVAPDDSLRIIDHQDARIGSSAYDLVSLLLDRVTEAPSPEWLSAKRDLFLRKREELGLQVLDPDAFASEFRLQTVQRCLKAIGTFSFQSARRGKTGYIPFIRPMLEIVLRACARLREFPVTAETISDELSREGD